jgi:hypothetical protein
MSPAPLRIDALTARRFVRRARLARCAGAGPRDGAWALGVYVQIDPINVCGRMHDLILRHRVTGYQGGRRCTTPSMGRAGPDLSTTCREGHGVLVALPAERLAVPDRADAAIAAGSRSRLLPGG